MQGTLYGKTRHLLKWAYGRARRLTDGSVCDLSGTPDYHPMDAIYESRGQPVLLRASMARFLHYTWLAYPAGQDSESPFIRTLVEYARGQQNEYIGSTLEAYYRHFQPASAAALMGLENPSCPRLAQVEPAGAVIPWQSDTPEQGVAYTQKRIRDENHENGGSFGYQDGESSYGPVSIRKGKLEFSRLTSIFDNIKSYGYCHDSHGQNNIMVTCLYSDVVQDWRLIIRAGQHRFAALAALGYPDVVVQLQSEGLGGVVQRQDVAHWPAVRQGYLTQTEALNLFDRIFAGKQPRG